MPFWCTPWLLRSGQPHPAAAAVASLSLRTWGTLQHSQPCNEPIRSHDWWSEYVRVYVRTVWSIVFSVSLNILLYWYALSDLLSTLLCPLFKLTWIGSLGHSGQAVHDIARQTLNTSPAVTESDAAAMDVDGTNTSSSAAKEQTGLSPLTILGNTLKWGHLCPTAPDTLPCYPYTENEPFVIRKDAPPHILFAGNQVNVGRVAVDNTVCVRRFHTCEVCL
jgi:hypothetical protein